MMGGNLPAVPKAKSAVARQVEDHATAVRRDQALVEIMRRAGSDLREQVEIMLRILGHAYEAVELVDEMREAGELKDGAGNAPTTGALLTLKDLGLSHRRLSDWRTLRELNAVAFVEQALSDERVATFERASIYWLRKRLERIAREGLDDESGEPDSTYEIRHGDFRDVLDDLDGQVDAIITDPPYPAKFIEEFDALGAKAAELLTPTGILVAMVGQSHLPAYIERLSRHLTYRWTGAYLTDGPATRIHQRKIGTKWKPLLVYDRGGERSFLTQDVFRSDADDKEHHGWGQSESGMADIVAHLTGPGQLVVDPFLGGGTTALVCRDLGRRYVGCDVDPKAVKTALERLA